MRLNINMYVLSRMIFGTEFSVLTVRTDNVKSHQFNWTCLNIHPKSCRRFSTICSYITGTKFTIFSNLKNKWFFKVGFDLLLTIIINVYGYTIHYFHFSVFQGTEHGGTNLRFNCDVVKESVYLSKLQKIHFSLTTIA
jgi:hypothetical protein